MTISAGGFAFRLTFAASPIILTGGIAGGMIGGALPIAALTSAGAFLTGILSSGSVGLGEDDFFALFQPLPGSTLIEQQVGMYPFANQAVAANATIQQPLTLSMLMVCAAGRSGGYLTKLATMTALQATLQQHNTMGGLYTIMTPAQVYVNGILTTMTDYSVQASKQVQSAYKLDFVFPLVSLAAAAAAQNTLMGQISGGVAPTGVPGAGSGQAPTLSPVAAGAGGAGQFGGIGGGAQFISQSTTQSVPTIGGF